MKISLGLSLVVLSVVAGFGWRDHRQLAALRGIHATLQAGAEPRGIAAGSGLLTKRARENRVTVAKLAAAGLIKLSKDRDAIKRAGGGLDPDPGDFESARARLIGSLDPAQIKTAIAGISNHPELDVKTRRDLIGRCVSSLAAGHPRQALDLFDEFSADLIDTELGWKIVRDSLAAWAAEDPKGALAWIRQNVAKFPGPIHAHATTDLVTGRAAAQDPAIAFAIVKEMGPREDNCSPFRQIFLEAKTPGKRTATLAAMQEYLATLDDSEAKAKATQSAYTNLAESVVHDSFESSVKWLATAKLTPAELAAVIGHLGDELDDADKLAETGRWVEWIGKNESGVEHDGRISKMVAHWTQNDFQAAGQWLAGTPDGPVKRNAIRTYAGTIASYEPRTAAQWAMTLPPGHDRDATLRRIYKDWPKGDAQAAAAFAKEHGIE